MTNPTRQQQAVLRDAVGRPRLHLSTPHGWINDPHGITWYRGQYHVFFQYVPGGADWAPECSWGHVTGRDLVTWDAAVDLTLEPDEIDDGCWSGALVLDGDRPTILYTRMKNDAAGPSSRIAVAVGGQDMRGWVKETRHVLEAPAGVSEFRDPSVQRDGAGWRLVVGGRQDGDAVALHFRSSDLHRWSDGTVLCRRRTGPDDAVATGDAWECVQFIELDGWWVLIASAWTHQVDDGVVYAVGSFDGRTFEPRSWRYLDHGGALYATTTFRDAENRWCALSWVREAEPARPGRTRAGAMSLPHLLALDGDRLVVAAHPDLDRLRGADLPPEGPLPPQCDIELTASARTVIGGLILDHDGEHLLLQAGSAPVRRMNVRAGTRVRIVLDEDIAEVFAGGDVAVLRMPERADRLVGAGRDTRVRGFATTDAEGGRS